jgi:hypothetical protein
MIMMGILSRLFMLHLSIKILLVHAYNLEVYLFIPFGKTLTELRYLILDLDK